jgi:hypothetical protein
MILNQFVCTMSGYYGIYIFEAFSIHDSKSVLFVPSQYTMIFIFFRRFQFMILIPFCVFHVYVRYCSTNINYMESNLGINTKKIKIKYL